MHLKFKQKQNTLIVSLIGELDHHAANSIRVKIDEEMKKSYINNFILDCKGLKFMDSSGIGMIIGRYKKIKSLHGRFYATNLNPQVKRIFNVSGLNRIIDTYSDNKTALKHM
ncbi:anti-sigma F factor antagonist [Clostridium sp. 'deep sea']|uniref:anti-sigma F factor antagonist n=1 Tax=Clostridium sp. 'deep sea' TaxID=2779445 RepID=UPI0018969858|nr:anti-sigma F factor antagonist [Clostridium sp. 'deep sea']QOR35826.1 anti-sigma F factor antagonist [Clostridium sp. 'deep sea']